MPENIYDIAAKTIDGHEVRLDAWRGQVLLVVNVASRCGFTPQYAGLEAMYRKHRDEGFAVLGFPCDQFGHQEPGDENEIKAFCEGSFGVTFPLFGKIDVNGPQAHPLFRYLKSQLKGLFGSERIKWNFTKFLIDRDGTPIRRFGSSDTPESIEAHVAAALATRPAPIDGL
jgi:glutathione peroxidase